MNKGKIEYPALEAHHRAGSRPFGALSCDQWRCHPSNTIYVNCTAADEERRIERMEKRRVERRGKREERRREGEER